MGDVHCLKEAEALQLGLGAIHQDAVIGVPFGQAQLLTDDGIKGLGVADDVDALDVDPGSFLDFKDHVDGVVGPVGGVARADVDEGETRRAGREG